MPNSCYVIWVSNCSEDLFDHVCQPSDDIFATKELAVNAIKNALSDGRFDLEWIYENIRQCFWRYSESLGQMSSQILDYEFSYNEEENYVLLEIKMADGELLKLIPFWIQEYNYISDERRSHD